MISRLNRSHVLTISLVSMAHIAMAAPIEKIPLSVQEPTRLARTEWPVTSGIPFPKGLLKGLHSFRLVQLDNGKELPLQERVTCRWPDGSLKWLLIDSRVTLAAGETKKLMLEAAQPGMTTKSAEPTDPGITVSQNEEDWTVSTGPLRAVFRPGANLPGPIHLDLNGDGKFTNDEEIAVTPWLLVLETPDGHRYTSDVLPAQIAVEEKGSLRTTLRIEGQLADSDRNPRFRYLIRLHFYVGRPFVRAFITLIVDVPDQVMVDIRSFKMVVPTPTSESYALDLGGEGTQTRSAHQIASAGNEHRLFQVDDQIYQLDGEKNGRRAAGWERWTNDRFTIGVGVRHFWQQWPKALSAGKAGVTAELIPSFEPGLYDNQSPIKQAKWTYPLRDGTTRLKIGVAKTHELWISYGRPSSATSAAGQFGQMFDPLLATCDPKYISATNALGDFPPADPAHPDSLRGYDRFVDRLFSEHLADRDKTREYGLLNFGDWWGERGCNWGNLEYDTQRGLIAQYARTGRRDFYLRAEEAARHHIDVDVVHAVNGLLKNSSGPPPVVGDVWVHATGHTGGYFEDGAFKMEKPYTAGYSRNWGHVWDQGDLDYYFLSGDERAREVGLQIAETLRLTAAPSFRIGTHMRDIGWPMRAMMAAYRATGDTKYLDAVRHGWDVLRANEAPDGGWIIKLAADHCLHKPAQCRGNVGFIMAIVISALCDYHRETGDAEVARAIVRAVDFTLRETYLPEKKSFRYTSCPLSPLTPAKAFFMSEIISYAYRLRGDEKYLRILRDSTETCIQSLSGSHIGKDLSQYLIFSPEGLWGLDATPAK